MIESQRKFTHTSDKSRNIMRIALEYAMIVSPEKVHELLGIFTHLCSWGGARAAEHEFVITPTWVTFRDAPPDNPDVHEGMLKYKDEEGHTHVMDLNYYNWGIYTFGKCIYNGGILFRDGEWTSHS